MELRRLNICIAMFLLAAVVRCSESHSVHRRASDDVNYDDPLLGDAASDDEAQNDADGGDDMEEELVLGNITTTPDNFQVSAGKTLRLQCRVVPSDGVVVQWSYSNQDVSDVKYFIGHARTSAPDRVTIAPNTTDLLIHEVQPSDSGAYKCMIIQEGSPYIVHNVLITESPRIHNFTSSGSGRLVEGQSLLLYCNATGSPPPQIVWSREIDNGNKRLEERDGEFSSNSVFIRNVTREHTGKYYCYAFNSVGNNQAEIFVKVYGKPRVHVHKTIVNSDINVEAILQCSTHEEKPVHIRWYKDGKLIEDSSSMFVVSTHDTHSNLTVIPTSPKDFGTFTCEAENTFGTHNRSIELVQNPVVEQLNVNGSTLTWKVHSHQPLERIQLLLKETDGDDTWKSFDVPLPETKSHKYYIEYDVHQMLNPGTYEAVVKVKNNNNWSNQLEPVKLDIEAQPHPIIQHASVFRSGAESIQQMSAVLLSTTLMYLLVRML